MLELDAKQEFLLFGICAPGAAPWPLSPGSWPFPSCKAVPPRPQSELGQVLMVLGRGAPAGEYFWKDVV